MEKEVSGRVIKALYDFTAHHKGSEAAEGLLVNLSSLRGENYNPKNLIDENLWFPLAPTIEVGNRVKEIFSDDEIIYKSQLEIPRTKSYGFFDIIPRLIYTSPVLLYKKLPQIIRDGFNKISIINVKELKSNSIIIEYRPIDKYFPPPKDLCLSMKGGFASIPLFWGFDSVQVEELECCAAGGKNCVYRISWPKKSLWNRTFGQYFNRSKLLQEAVQKLEDDKFVLEQKYEEIHQLNMGLEQKVKERTKDLEQSNKLKDLFISIMDHDIKNYLSTIWGYALMLEDNKTAEINNYGKVIERNARKVDELISGARIFSQLQDPDLKLKFTRQDLYQIINTLLHDLDAMIKNKKIEIVSTIPPNKYYFNGLPLASEIFSNLISNAIKYSKEASKVELYTEEQGNSFIFCVKDTGSGIPSEYKEVIFERFERLESHKASGIEGSGLGLAIVKALVSLHCGQVWVEDNFGQGSIFKVKLEKG